MFFFIKPIQLGINTFAHYLSLMVILKSNKYCEHIFKTIKKNIQNINAFKQHLMQYKFHQVSIIIYLHPKKNTKFRRHFHNFFFKTPSPCFPAYIIKISCSVFPQKEGATAKLQKRIASDCHYAPLVPPYRNRIIQIKPPSSIERTQDRSTSCEENGICCRPTSIDRN